MGNGRRFKEELGDARQDRRGRAHAGRARPGPALARRRLHPADHRPLAARPEDLRHEPRRDHLDAQAARRGGRLRRRLVRRDRLDRGADRQRDGRGQRRLRRLRRRLEVPVVGDLHPAGRARSRTSSRPSGGKRPTTCSCVAARADAHAERRRPELIVILVIALSSSARRSCPRSGARRQGHAGVQGVAVSGETDEDDDDERPRDHARVRSECSSHRAELLERDRRARARATRRTSAAGWSASRDGAAVERHRDREHRGQPVALRGRRPRDLLQAIERDRGRRRRARRDLPLAHALGARSRRRPTSTSRPTGRASSGSSSGWPTAASRRCART